MRKITLALALVGAALLASSCSHATAPSPRPEKPSKLTVCRGDWTITLGRYGEAIDSTFGC